MDPPVAPSLPLFTLPLMLAAHTLPFLSLPPSLCRSCWLQAEASASTAADEVGGSPGGLAALLRRVPRLTHLSLVGCRNAPLPLLAAELQSIAASGHR